MTDHLFKEIAASGYLINNLYQVDANLWRCSLRSPMPSGGFFTGWAEAPTLEAVLEEALESTANAEFVAERAQSFTIDQTPEPARLDSLLNLIRPAAKPAPKLIRRTL